MKPVYFTKTRSYRAAEWVDFWLIRKSGDTEASVLWGVVHPKVADEIAEALGLKNEKDHRDYVARQTSSPGCVPPTDLTEEK